MPVSREDRFTVNLDDNLYDISEVESVEGEGDEEGLKAFYDSDTWFIATTDGLLYEIDRADMDQQTEHLLSEFVQTM